MTSPPASALSCDELLARADRYEPGHVWSSFAPLAQRIVAIDSDDLALFDDFFTAFGGGEPIDGPAPADAFVSASIRVHADPEFGWMRLRRDGRPQPVDDVFFGLTFPDCPFDSRAIDGGWTEVRSPGEEPLFAYRSDVCLFWKRHDDWRGKLLSLLYRGALFFREDLIFFHASALSVDGKGVMLVGRKKAGKSTTSLAIAARGHAILADSCACYQPSTGLLVPFRRPVGIREGPRAKAVDEALSRNPIRVIERDESRRVDVATLLPVRESGSVPATAIFFLRDFAPVTRVERLKSDASELANLRPIYSSFANAPHTQRVFELIRLLSRARLYAIWPGSPDETARSVEEVMRCP